MHKMKKILIVDDEPDVNITLRKVLEKSGFIVDSYENPLLALDNFKPHYYDLITERLRNLIRR
jgi:CheY-like chemotaxis protein